MKRGKEACKIRALRFMLTSGVEEVLIANLFDEKYTIEDFKVLYFRRWGIEIKLKHECKTNLNMLVSLV